MLRSPPMTAGNWDWYVKVFDLKVVYDNSKTAADVPFERPGRDRPRDPPRRI